MLLETMQQQVEEQCQFALTAIGGMNGCLGAMTELREQGAHRDMQKQSEVTDQLWFFANAFLTAVANIAKHLWPGRRLRKDVREAFPDRGVELRASLGVPDESPLDSRMVRNHFEHADERLEEWWIDNPQHNIARRTIGDARQAISLGPGMEMTFHSQFDPDRLTISFLGDEIELQPLADAISELYERATQATDPSVQFEKRRAEALERRNIEAEPT